MTPDGQSVPATGRETELPACYVLGIRDNKVIDRHDYFDMATILRHLGVMPGA